VYFALNYLSHLRPFRNVDDTLGVIYTHGFAGFAGGLMVGLFASSKMVVYQGLGSTASIDVSGLFQGGGWHLLKEQFYAGIWVIGFTAIGTYILLKLIGLVIPLRMTDEQLEEGDLAIHGHEVYPSDVPSLAYTGSKTAAEPAT
jgi:Amt family ammonium transporter